MESSHEVLISISCGQLICYLKTYFIDQSRMLVCNQELVGYFFYFIYEGGWLVPQHWWCIPGEEGPWGVSGWGAKAARTTRTVWASGQGDPRDSPSSTENSRPARAQCPPWRRRREEAPSHCWREMRRFHATPWHQAQESRTRNKLLLTCTNGKTTSALTILVLKLDFHMHTCSIQMTQVVFIYWMPFVWFYFHFYFPIRQPV